jgi:hypothetical protein
MWCCSSIVGGSSFCCEQVNGNDVEAVKLEEEEEVESSKDVYCIADNNTDAES